MNTLEKYLESVVYKKNRELYFSISLYPDDKDTSISNIIDRVRKQIGKKYGNKYIELLKMEKIKISTEYDSSSIDIVAKVMETDEDRDARIIVDTLNFTKQFNNNMELEKKRLENLDKMELKLYTRLKRKYGKSIK